MVAEVRDRDFRIDLKGAAIVGLPDILREREKTKRLLIGAIVVLFLAASSFVLFAPPGREEIAIVLGAALLVLALGAIGASGFLLRLPGGVSVDTLVESARAARPDEAEAGARPTSAPVQLIPRAPESGRRPGV
jgi:hypothetical protein